MNKTIIITGGAGFIGSHLTDQYINKGYKVAVLDNLSTGLEENLNSKAKFYQGDIKDRKFVKKVFNDFKPKIVNHQAAHLSVPESVEDPEFNLKNNILGSINLLEESKNVGVKKIITASTGGAIYGDSDTIPTPEDEKLNPISPYGVSKLAVEKYLFYYGKEFGIDWVSVRYSNVYGPRQNTAAETGVISLFIDQIMNNEQPYIYGDGKQTRDYIFVDDVVRANIITEEKGNGIYNVGTGKETNVIELFNLIQKEAGTNFPKKHKPIRKGEQRRSSLDISKIGKELGWKPKTSINEGIKRTLNWYKNR